MAYFTIEKEEIEKMKKDGNKPPLESQIKFGMTGYKKNMTRK